MGKAVEDFAVGDAAALELAAELGLDGGLRVAADGGELVPGAGEGEGDRLPPVHVEHLVCVPMLNSLNYILNFNQGKV